MALSYDWICWASSKRSAHPCLVPLYILSKILIPDEWHKNGVRMRLRMSSSVLFPYIYLPLWCPIRMTLEWCLNENEPICLNEDVNEPLRLVPLYMLSKIVIPDEWHKNGVRMRLRMSSSVLFPYISCPMFNPIRMTSELHQNDGRQLFVMTPEWCYNEVS